MFSAVAELGVPIVMMHMRGTPQTMTHKEFTTYPTGDCIQEIASGDCPAFDGDESESESELIANPLHPCYLADCKHTTI